MWRECLTLVSNVRYVTDLLAEHSSIAGSDTVCIISDTEAQANHQLDCFGDYEFHTCHDSTSAYPGGCSGGDRSCCWH
jgi:hypothetical protein